MNFKSLLTFHSKFPLILVILILATNSDIKAITELELANQRLTYLNNHIATMTEQDIITTIQETISIAEIHHLNVIEVIKQLKIKAQKQSVFYKQEIEMEQFDLLKLGILLNLIGITFGVCGYKVEQKKNRPLEQECDILTQNLKKIGINIVEINKQYNKYECGRLVTVIEKSIQFTNIYNLSLHNQIYYNAASQRIISLRRQMASGSMLSRLSWSISLLSFLIGFSSLHQFFFSDKKNLELTIKKYEILHEKFNLLIRKINHILETKTYNTSYNHH